MLLKCLKNSQILRLIEAANNLPPHWLLVPTQGKQPLGFEWQKYPYNPITLATTLAFGSIQVKNREQKLYNVVPTGFGVICGRNEREYLVAIDCDGANVHSKIPPLPKTIAWEHLTFAISINTYCNKSCIPGLLAKIGSSN